MVGTNTSAVCLDLLGLSVFLSSLWVIIVIFIWVFFCLNIKRSEETVFVGDQDFIILMVVESVNSLLVIFIVLIKLERFSERILIEKFWIVLDQPLSSSITVEDNDMFLSQDQRTDQVIRSLMLDIIGSYFLTTLT